MPISTSTFKIFHYGAASKNFWALFFNLITSFLCLAWRYGTNKLFKTKRIERSKDFVYNLLGEMDVALFR